MSEYTIIQNKEFNFNQDESGFDFLTMVVLIGKDGSCNHAITIYKIQYLIHHIQKFLKELQRLLTQLE